MRKVSLLLVLVAALSAPRSLGADGMTATTARVLVAEAHLRAGEYAAALAELRLAQRQHPGAVPAALRYDLGLCLDRLGRDAEAALEYEAFLAAPGDPWELERVRQRLVELKAITAQRLALATVAATPPRPPTPARSRRHWIAPAVLGGLALGVAAALVGVHVSIGERTDLLRRSGSCAPACDPAELRELERRAAAVYGLGASLGVVLAVDLGLWIGALLQERRAGASSAARASLERGRF